MTQFLRRDVIAKLHEQDKDFGRTQLLTILNKYHHLSQARTAVALFNQQQAKNMNFAGADCSENGDEQDEDENGSMNEGQESEQSKSLRGSQQSKAKPAKETPKKDDNQLEDDGPEFFEDDSLLNPKKYALLNPNIPPDILLDISPSQKMLFSQFSLIQMQQLEKGLFNMYKSLNAILTPDGLRDKFKFNYRSFFELNEGVIEALECIMDCSKSNLIMQADQDDIDLKAGNKHTYMNEEQREAKLQFLIDNVEEKDMFQIQF